MADRPVILILVQYFRPAYRAGGAARSISNLVDHLGDEFDFHIVCRDRDLGDTEPFDLPCGQWTKIGKAQVWYETLNKSSALTILKLLRSRHWDAVYCNSYFNPVFSIMPRVFNRLGLAKTKGLIVAPRGEFAQDALKISASKKQRFLKWAKRLKIDDGVLFQASVEHEARDITKQRSNAKSRIRVAADLTPVDELENVTEALAKKTRGELRLVMIARIAPIKNIALAVEALRGCSAQIRFDLYGPMEAPDYWKDCQSAITELPDN
ncbi:MAG: hypothetical protein ABJ135_00570, partial [Marinomonas sp.]